MKNTHYDINELFNVIKGYYVNHFPHSVKADAIDVVNYHLKRLGSSARIGSTVMMTTEFKNPNPTKPRESDFRYKPVIKLEEYLESSHNRMELIEDIKALREWLKNQNYLYVDNDKYVATKELLVTSFLIKL